MSAPAAPAHDKGRGPSTKAPAQPVFTTSQDTTSESASMIPQEGIQRGGAGHVVPRAAMPGFRDPDDFRDPMPEVGPDGDIVDPVPDLLAEAATVVERVTAEHDARHVARRDEFTREHPWCAPCEMRDAQEVYGMSPDSWDVRPAETDLDREVARVLAEAGLPPAPPPRTPRESLVARLTTRCAAYLAENGAEPQEARDHDPAKDSPDLVRADRRAADERAARKLAERTAATMAEMVEPSAIETASPPTATAAPAGKATTAQIVTRYAKATFTPHRAPSGEAFAIPRTGEPLPVMLGKEGGGLRSRVRADLFAQDGTVVGAEALANGLGVFAAEVDQLLATTPLHLRCAYEPGRLVIDLGQPGTARCIVIGPTGWRVEPRPPEGVYFRRPSSLMALPDPVAGGSLEPLRHALGFEAHDPRWHLVRGWVVTSALPHIARPILAFIGPAGSGKTTRARNVVSVLDPRDELGSSFGRNLDDDRTSALSRFLVGYDNLTSVSDSISDHLARLVTGETSEKRKNFSDTGVITMSYRRTGALTAVTLPALKSDALERILPITLDRMPRAARTSEQRLREAFTVAHPQMLGALCDGLAQVLRNLPAVLAEDAETPRMKDYALALLALDRTAFDVYCQSADDVLRTAAEDDPIVRTVRQWLAERPALGGTVVSVEPGAAYSSMKQTARSVEIAAPWWPRDSAALGKTLQRASGPLAAVGISFRTGRSNGNRRWIFEPASGGEGQL